LIGSTTATDYIIGPFTRFAWYLKLPFSGAAHACYQDQAAGNSRLLGNGIKPLVAV
jgi:hypothetical protein